MNTEMKSTACILCSLNCGIKVQTENGHLKKIIGDKAHPVSQGYVCEKTQRLDYYQNGADRLDTPMRRKADGSYEAIDWDTAIREVAEKFTAVRDEYGGDKITYYGGGGQGNHLCGGYAASWTRALGVKYRSSALAQEKTGEFWVMGEMFGTFAHGHFDHSEVAIMMGKNPWQSHGFARARAVIREIQKDPARALIVIDPRRTETADKAEFHLQVKPGTDAWCLAAMVAILVQGNHVDQDWLDQHTTGFDAIKAAFVDISVADYAARCGVEESLLRAVVERIVAAKSVAVFEDLGTQMAPHSTLNSWLQRLLWLTNGHFAKPGTSSPLVSFMPLIKPRAGESKRSPVLGEKIITGLIPCNIIADEVLADHPNRYRAMIIDSGNPVHSVADSQKFRAAMRQVDVSVVIDVAMTETAREADYVLPACSQFEKAEATFFNAEAPRNTFHLRAPLFEPMPGTLPEAEIHARLLEAMGIFTEDDYSELRAAAEQGLDAYAAAFMTAAGSDPRIMKYVSVFLYRTLGPSLPKGMEQAAAVWGLCLMYIGGNATAAARVGWDGDMVTAANKLFTEMLTNPSGVVFGEISTDEMWAQVSHADNKIRLDIPEMLTEFQRIDNLPQADTQQYPFVLSAGERRSGTTNTIVRDPAWHKKGVFAGLRISPEDAETLGCEDGDVLRLTTNRASGEVAVEISDTMQAGHISLPNGNGLDYTDDSGKTIRYGTAPNEFTDSARRDVIAGTPWHKNVPARLERVA